MARGAQRGPRQSRAPIQSTIPSRDGPRPVRPPRKIPLASDSSSKSKALPPPSSRPRKPDPSRNPGTFPKTLVKVNGNRQPHPTQPQSQPLNSSAAAGQESFQSRYQSIKRAREKERARAIANGFLADPNKPRTLAEAITPVGTCRDMCPEFERVERVVQNDIWTAEVDPNKRTDSSWKQLPDEARMVKKFRRAAAGLDEQLPSDLRPPQVLQRTVDYLFNTVVGEADSLASVHHFVWDRTRAIRNDFSIQQLTKPSDVRVAIDCYERIARFHILSLHQLALPERPYEQYDAQQEREQLDKTLLSLMQYYEDSRGRLESPNEAEFRSYCIIFQIQDPSPNLEDRMQTWPNKILEDGRIQRAFKLYSAASNATDPQGPLRPRTHHNIAQANWRRFWNLVDSNEISYLMACVAEIYFPYVRKMALNSLWNAYRQGNNKQVSEWPLDELMDVLGMESEDDVQDLCEQFGFTVAEREDGVAYLELNSLSGRFFPDPRISQRKSAFVEDKRRCRHLSPVISGMSVKSAKQLDMVEEDTEDITREERKKGTGSLFVSDDSDSERQPHEPGVENKQTGQSSAGKRQAGALNPFAFTFHPPAGDPSASTSRETSSPQASQDRTWKPSQGIAFDGISSGFGGTQSGKAADVASQGTSSSFSFGAKGFETDSPAPRWQHQPSDVAILSAQAQRPASDNQYVQPQQGAQSSNLFQPKPSVDLGLSAQKDLAQGANMNGKGSPFNSHHPLALSSSSQFNDASELHQETNNQSPQAGPSLFNSASNGGSPFDISQSNPASVFAQLSGDNKDGPSSLAKHSLPQISFSPKPQPPDPNPGPAISLGSKSSNSLFDRISMPPEPKPFSFASAAAQAGHATQSLSPGPESGNQPSTAVDQQAQNRSTSFNTSGVTQSHTQTPSFPTTSPLNQLPKPSQPAGSSFNVPPIPLTSDKTGQSDLQTAPAPLSASERIPFGPEGFRPSPDSISTNKASKNQGPSHHQPHVRAPQETGADSKTRSFWEVENKTRRHSHTIDALTNNMMFEPSGFLDQYVEYIVGPLAFEVDLRNQAEKYRLAKLMTHYGKRWRDISHKRRLARRGRERRRRARDAQVKAQQARQYSISAQLDEFRKNEADMAQESRNELETKTSRAIQQEATAKYRQTMMPPPLTRPMRSNLNQSQPSHKGRPTDALSGTRLSRTVDIASRPSSSLSQASSKSSLTSSRSSTYGRRFDTTRSTYFRLKAMGLDPRSANLYPQSKQMARPTSPTSSRVHRPLLVNSSSQYSPDMYTERSRKRSQADFTESQDYFDNAEGSSSPDNTITMPPPAKRPQTSSASPNNHLHRRSSTTGQEEDEDEALFSAVRQARQAMTDSIDFFRSEIEKDAESRQSSQVPSRSMSPSIFSTSRLGAVNVHPADELGVSLNGSRRSSVTRSARDLPLKYRSRVSKFLPRERYADVKMRQRREGGASSLTEEDRRMTARPEIRVQRPSVAEESMEVPLRANPYGNSVQSIAATGMDIDLTADEPHPKVQTSQSKSGGLSAATSTASSKHFSSANNAVAPSWTTKSQTSQIFGQAQEPAIFTHNTVGSQPEPEPQIHSSSKPLSSKPKPPPSRRPKAAPRPANTNAFAALGDDNPDGEEDEESEERDHADVNGVEDDTFKDDCPEPPDDGAFDFTDESGDYEDEDDEELDGDEDGDDDAGGEGFDKGKYGGKGGTSAEDAIEL